jgi:CheY-like chemotaxis protein
MNLPKPAIKREQILLYSSIPEDLAKAGRVLEAAGFSTMVWDDLDNQEWWEKLEHHEGAHQKYLAELSDDLRNSLSAISNAVALLKLTSSDRRSTQIAKDILERQTGHLIDVVNSLDAPRANGNGRRSRRKSPERNLSARMTCGPVKRLLVVDDNQDAARGLAMLLENLGYQVYVAHDGSTALELAGRYNPQVFLLDLGLAGFDGYQVAERLRADSRFSRMWLVAITGHSLNGKESRERVKTAGFDYFLTKPVDLESLQAFLTENACPEEPG